jgi:hypothetical protein
MNKIKPHDRIHEKIQNCFMVFNFRAFKTLTSFFVYVDDWKIYTFIYFSGLFVTI